MIPIKTTKKPPCQSQEVHIKGTSKNQNNKNKPTPPVMVTRYNPNNSNIRKFIHWNLKIIEHCDELKKIFTQKPIIRFRRLPNLGDILSKNLLSSQTRFTRKPEIDTPKFCIRLGKCTYCPKRKKFTTFTNHHTGNKHKCTNHENAANDSIPNRAINAYALNKRCQLCHK